MKVLIVEDDAKLATLIARGLRQDGYVIDWEIDGESGYDAAAGVAYDVIVLDVMLPKRSGFDITKALRRQNIATPILLLTALDTPQDAVAGLDAGADDYLRKPFAFEELEARIRSLSRRIDAPPRILLRVGDVTFDTVSKQVERKGRPVRLTSRELAYLEYFMRNAGIVVTRRMLEDALWDRDGEINSNAVEVYVRRLRSKLEFDDLPSLITTVYGIGYRFGRDETSG
jgi:DNA-binding response OmpR family regulator